MAVAMWVRAGRGRGPRVAAGAGGQGRELLYRLLHLLARQSGTKLPNKSLKETGGGCLDEGACLLCGQQQPIKCTRFTVIVHRHPLCRFDLLSAAVFSPPGAPTTRADAGGLRFLAASCRAALLSTCLCSPAVTALGLAAAGSPVLQRDSRIQGRAQRGLFSQAQRLLLVHKSAASRSLPAPRSVA
eukprot:3828156-Rhodomonas_salina.2